MQGSFSYQQKEKKKKKEKSLLGDLASSCLREGFSF